MTLCPTCGDSPEWCPEAKGTLKNQQTPAPPTSVGEWREDASTAAKPEHVESPATLGQDVIPRYQALCGYCDAPTFVSGPGHSVHCPRYEKVKRTRRA
jgi:hypothetical protein